MLDRELAGERYFEQSHDVVILSHVVLIAREQHPGIRNRFALNYKLNAEPGLTLNVVGVLDDDVSLS